ncbi:MAG: chemotaxis protein CheA [Thermodesulfobacteriota bacterium]|nr:chemotaxis protein CheA [Thermodesulfobacteriota bacterium]
MFDLLERIRKNLESITLEVVTLDKYDIPALGRVLNTFCTLENEAIALKEPTCIDLIRAIKGYLEQLIMGEAEDLELIEKGIEYLQSLLRSLQNEEVFKGDISQILDKLGFSSSPPHEGEMVEEYGQPDDAKEEKTTVPLHDHQVDESNKEILKDFIIESLENLGTIEVNLMDLEQCPDDLETINSIFRAFHTIKGVSSFLNLSKINKVAHSTEGILDKARNREINIEETIIDIILESVDLLKKMIEGVREGLENGVSLDSEVDIIPLLNHIDEINSRAEQVGDKRVGEILIQKGTIATDDLEDGLERQRKEPGKKIGEILVEERRAESKEVISALRDQKKYGRHHIDLHVKVDTKKLDSLVDLTGELVIAQSMLKQNQDILALNDQGVSQNLNQLTQITSNLQTTAMSMRMVPIRDTFQKMVRLVRDLAKHSGKEVLLDMSGEDTEIDRNVVEELYEPMVHMIRNAVDHGLETPEEREKTGKERCGTIHLRAYYRGGNVIVEIKDDGRGLNKDRIIEKARSANLITDETKMTESEMYNLIFQPGFSTAEKVTDISGRGVGMDVVKKSIEKLRGRVEINSRPTQGSTFVIRLPLTLAIIEGMLVRVGEERYIIPALAILESFKPDKSQYFTVEGKGEMIMSRGNLIPLIRLDWLFGLKGNSVHPWDGLVVAVEHEDEPLCLLLDELLGKEDIVIKNLGESIKNIKGIAGGAIMGDGKVGLILDMAGIFELAKNN